MRKMIIIILLSLLNPAVSATEKKADELITLANLMTESDMEVEKWQVVMKEKVTKERVLSIVEHLKSDHEVRTINGQKVTKYVIVDTHNDDKFSVSYNMIVPTEKKYASEIIVIIEGQTWNEFVLKNYEDKVAEIYRQFLTQNVKKFTCLSSSSDAIIKGVYFFDTLQKELNLQYISTQTDLFNENVHTDLIYGYTTIWDEQIINNDTPMNLQIVIKQLQENRSKLTVGTPLLINEY